MQATGAALPTVFLSHGSPMHALEAGASGKAWAALGERLPRPRALLIASAHWEAEQPMLGGSARPETIHDFHGFPQPLYQIRYPSPGAPALALRAQALLRAAGLQADIDPERGLDHGAWSPLLYAYPGADVPVLQVSVQTRLGPRHHLALGAALAPLAGEGVLIIGSGHLTHNLRELRSLRDTGVGSAQPYVAEFQAWVRERIEAHELERLADYRRLSAAGARAHPTEEHFLPLFAALGAAHADYRAERFVDHVEGGVLAMDAYLFHPAH
ncbi:MAG TPA: class III extradiol ring-cleavage dioxygenase [Burkholderiales bacterium]|nr:class III extradiol ring-cleavage dioxygenase [Burkholderiales bacterium]